MDRRAGPRRGRDLHRGVPGQRIVLDWGWEMESDAFTSTVTITVEPAEGGTLVRLVHEGLTKSRRPATSRVGLTSSSGSNGLLRKETRGQMSGRSPRQTPT